MTDLITARDGVSADNAALTLSFVGRTGGRELVRIVNGDLERDPLRDAIVMSLFTWRRADKDDELPAGASRQGWFGDSGLGSRLWTIRKLSSEATVDARAFAAEALAWLVGLGVASAIDVEIARSGSALLFGITVRRPLQPVTTVRYDLLWGE
jgi:phage gp46-like protein